MENNNLKIKRIELLDINELVNIHCATFKSFFLTELGEEFLSVYYTAFCSSKQGIILGCFENEKLIGFCAGAEKSSGFNSGLIIGNFFAFTVQGFKLLFTNINALVRLYNNLKKANDKIKDDGQYAELFSIAVSPLKQNSGIGKLLLEELEYELKQRKCTELSLTTDHDNNENTLKFYNKMGYKVKYEFETFPERKMYRLIKQLQ